MFQPSPRHGLPDDGKLSVHHRTYDDARAFYPHDKVVAVRAFVKSEAARLANKVVFPCQPDARLSDFVSSIIDIEWVRVAALRNRRADLMILLVRSPRFKRRVVSGLVKRGKIDAETARAVLA